MIAILISVKLVCSDSSDNQKFSWGAVTAAYQIECAVVRMDEVDRSGQVSQQQIFKINLKLNISSAHHKTCFSHIPDHIQNGDDGDIADDSYHKFSEDIKFMKNMGINAYSFFFNFVVSNFPIRQW